jgi:hypothetical protein
MKAKEHCKLFSGFSCRIGQKIRPMCQLGKKQAKKSFAWQRGFEGLQISGSGPNIYKDTLKCRLFLKIYQKSYLVAGVYLAEAPDPSSLQYIPLYLFTQGRVREGLDAPVIG